MAILSWRQNISLVENGKVDSGRMQLMMMSLLLMTVVMMMLMMMRWRRNKTKYGKFTHHTRHDDDVDDDSMK